MGSLRFRVLKWVSGLLILIFALTIVGLDMAFRNTSRSALDDLLNAQLLGLIAVARPDPGSGLTLPDDLAESRFNMTNSGLYGALWNASERLVWRSWSLLDTELDFGGIPVVTGERVPRDMLGPGGDKLKGLVMSIDWEFDDGTVQPYTFGVATSLAPYEERQQAFRWTLIGWFAGATVITLFALWFLLFWVWRPLRRLASEVVEIEQGDRSKLSGNYPSELAGLSSNLDNLVESERRRQTRYRNTLDNLAHSLKTPLAVMGSLLAERWQDESKRSLEKEVERMRERVTYHLEQARVSGGTTLGLRKIDISPIVHDVKESLDKVYLDKNVQCSVRLEEPLEIQAEPGDVLEIVGNLDGQRVQILHPHGAIERFRERRSVAVGSGG